MPDNSDIKKLAKLTGVQAFRKPQVRLKKPTVTTGFVRKDRSALPKEKKPPVGNRLLAVSSLPDEDPLPPIHPLRARFEAMVKHAADSLKRDFSLIVDRDNLDELRLTEGIAICLENGMRMITVLRIALPAFWAGRDNYMLEFHQNPGWSVSHMVEAFAHDAEKHGHAILSILYKVLAAADTQAESHRRENTVPAAQDVLRLLAGPVQKEFRGPFDVISHHLRNPVRKQKPKVAVAAKEPSVIVDQSAVVAPDVSKTADDPVQKLVDSITSGWGDDVEGNMFTIAVMLCEYWKAENIADYAVQLDEAANYITEQDPETRMALMENNYSLAENLEEKGMSEDPVLTVFHSIIRAYLYSEVPEGHCRFDAGDIQGKLEVLNKNARGAIQKALSSLVVTNLPRQIHDFAVHISTTIENTVIGLGGSTQHDDGDYDRYVLFPSLEGVVDGSVDRRQIEELFKNFVESQLERPYGNAAFFLTGAMKHPKPNVYEERAMLMVESFSLISNEQLKKDTMVFWAMYRVAMARGKKHHSYSAGQVSVLRLIHMLSLLGWEIPFSDRESLVALGNEEKILLHWADRGYVQRRNAFGELDFAKGFGLNPEEVEGIIERGLANRGGGNRPGGESLGGSALTVRPNKPNKPNMLFRMLPLWRRGSVFGHA